MGRNRRTTAILPNPTIWGREVKQKRDKKCTFEIT
jgi:hypothetical protein